MLINGVEREIKPFSNLTGANLTRADLTRANLTGANLTGAYLTGAYGLSMLHNTYLPDVTYTALKAVGKDYKSLMVHTSPGTPLDYTPGTVVNVKGAETDRRVLCGPGINVSDMNYYSLNHGTSKVVLVEFLGSDVAAVPYASDGKFRLHRCKVLRDVTEEVKRFIKEQSNGPTNEVK